jgi:hypothetical protein
MEKEMGKLTVHVNSSSIKAIAYESQLKEMEVTFHRGDQREYHFYGVPPDVFQEFALSSSPGRYYADHIKGRYTQPGGMEG